MVIFAEFGLYIFIRQVVRGLEWLFACRLIPWLRIIATTNSVLHPGRGRKGLLRFKLRGAKTYAEWKAAALTLDQYLGFDEWKKVCGLSLVERISYSTSHRRTEVPSLITSL
jgi:hypothetical protein